jgi:hypothetical protein
MILVKLAWPRYTLEFSVVKEWGIDSLVLTVDCSWFLISQLGNVTGLTVTVSSYNFKVEFQMYNVKISNIDIQNLHTLQ